MEPSDREARCAVFLTEAKEYVVRDRVCLRLRDRRTGRLEPILPNRVLGAVPPPPEHYLFDTGEPRVGDRLCIQVGNRYLVSSPILAVEHTQVSEANHALPTRAARPRRHSPGA